MRWDKPKVPPRAGASGRRRRPRPRVKRNFDRLFELSEILGGEVGATRVPVFNGWCGEERMIGQTGKTIRPRLYLGFGISGQIQHTASIVDSEIIVSINTNQERPSRDIRLRDHRGREYLSVAAYRFSAERKTKLGRTVQHGTGSVLPPHRAG